MIMVEPFSEERNRKLILEKIAIPSSSLLLARPRLLSLLQKSVNSCSSTVVSGRAGTGKTALVTDFARLCLRPVAWYKVDASDVELRIFVEYLIASIRLQRPGFDQQSIMSLVRDPQFDDIRLLTESFIFELLEGEGKPLLIVIEDLHLVSDAEWLVPFLGRFLPLLPRDIHVLITSRTLPPAPLWRMRSKQTLAVISEEALAFTPEEAAELFEWYGLAPQHAQLAFEQTRGRAGALMAYAFALTKSQTRQENHGGHEGSSDSDEAPESGVPFC